MIIMVVGVPGVGKTSVINEAKKYLKYEFKVVSTGDIMFELAKEKYNK
jgi:adenylate kinase